MSLTTTSKGLPSWDFAVEFTNEVPTEETRVSMMGAVLEDVRVLAAALRAEYPEGTPL